MTRTKQGAVRLFSAAFLAPALVLYVAFVAIPILMSAYYGMTDWRIMGGRSFVFLDNFRKLAGDQAYWLSARNTVVVAATSLLVQLPVAFVVAYLLYRRGRGTGFFRTAYFIPVVVSPIAIGTMFSLFYSGEMGPLNALLDALGAGFLKRKWLADKDVVLASVIFPDVWRFIGYYVVLCLSGMASLPKEVLEGATIDGASGPRTFFSVVVPLMADVIGIAVVLSVTGCLKAFEMPLALTDGGPGAHSTYLSLYMFKTAFTYQKFGYGSAVTMTILAYALAFTALYRRLFKAEEY